MELPKKNIDGSTRLPFAIEPPMQVHSPNFLQQAIERAVPVTRGWANRPADNALITHSTVKTYGHLDAPSMISHAGMNVRADEESTLDPLREKAEAVRENFEPFISMIFEKAINPTGHDVDLEFVFDKLPNNLDRNQP